GTGKTTLAQHLVEGYSARFCAYTGKAALVLREKGCAGASTIHRLIYRPREVLDASGVRGVAFELCQEGELASGLVDVVVADECSMIDERTARDLLSFGIKVLVLGDPFQLPPVSGQGAFSSLEPTWLLTEVHRQARESGILRLATDVREGRGVDGRPGAYGSDVQVLSAASADPMSIIPDVDQVLVGTNRARRDLNQWVRNAVGVTNKLPVAGDKVVCLRNNHDRGLINGGQWQVVSSGSGRRRNRESHVTLELESLDAGLGGPSSMRTTAHPHYFLGEEDEIRRLPWILLREHQEFDYAYAMTVHKGQGSQWDRVCVLDESRVFGEHAARHLYTAVTRAARSLVLLR
ncbi:MAG: ATP-dependent DNA helicase, partial [Kofleriaceae bacterium]